MTRFTRIHTRSIRPPAALASVACGGAITRPPSLALACRAIAFTVVAALAACAEHGNPTSPSTSVVPSGPRLTVAAVRNMVRTRDQLPMDVSHECVPR